LSSINVRRIWLGALVGGLVFFVWSMVMEFGVSAALVGSARRDVAVTSGWFLAVPRVPTAVALSVWTLSLFVIAAGLAWAYAAMRATAGAGPRTAALLGLVVGFAAGFPLEFMHAVFQPLSARYALGWMIEMGGGCVLAALAAGWTYRDAAPGPGA
jgi:hypothetical protein